jgi:hypothetical protein
MKYHHVYQVSIDKSCLSFRGSPLPVSGLGIVSQIPKFLTMPTMKPIDKSLGSWHLGSRRIHMQL